MTNLARRRVVPLRCNIHETASLHPDAQLGVGVEIGPYSYVGPEVVIGDGTRIGPRVILQGPVTMGRGNRVYTGARIGGNPRAPSYEGPSGPVLLGDNNIIREYVTIAGGCLRTGNPTRLGNQNFIMCYVQVGSECSISERVVMTHRAVAHHGVTIEDRVIISGLSSVRQHTRIGRVVMVGALTKITKDLPPFVIVRGNPARVHGVNVEGLRRSGMSQEQRAEVRRAFKVLYRSGLPLPEAIERLDQDFQGNDVVSDLVRFLRGCRRGVCP